MNEPHKTVFPILAALVVAIFPHIGRLPPWIIFWCVVMWGYILLSFRFNWPRPGKNLRRVLTIIGIFGLLFTFSRRLDQDAYLGLLAVMAALKPFEMETHRDRMITVFLAYFIVITSLFLSETLLITIYMFMSVIVTTAVLIRTNDPGGRFTANLRLSALIMAQALPVMVLLFFLFPRIEGSLFGLWFSSAAKSGFSDSLSPGGVVMLVENDAVAFRVSFDGETPSASLLYWRGIVFSDFDGRGWHVQRHSPENPALPKGQNPTSYTVTLEPHHYRWLFVLEMPAEPLHRAAFLNDYTLRTPRPVSRQMRYEMTSYTRYHTGPEDEKTLRQCILLPENSNTRTHQLAAEITADASTAVEKADQVFNFFRDNGFTYTLEPPRLGRHPVDDFIFASRRGYCEHYASAFAFMMRAVNVPARVVGGYLGGEINPYANYLIVRQLDAHAWVEIWDPENGWIRVDPTAAVAPDRISEGMRSVLSAGGAGGFFERLGGLSSFFHQARLGWDAINTGWRAFFEGYSYEVQRALLEKIGIRSGVLAASFKAMLLMVALAGMIIGGYAWFFLRPPRQKPDAVQKYYARYCEKLARAGFARKPDQGPIDYMQLVLKNRPDLQKQIAPITDLYVRLRYRDQAAEGDLAAFVEKVRKFDPALKR
ncbi:MAG: DUF3488 domain-containing protein [Desulfobacteraceae bacterium]|jgi:transglutaminase-like putative cysteine protease|nr:MAG: DUF3488 domain-containing protein [Desulfobacteraceae bacterium]